MFDANSRRRTIEALLERANSLEDRFAAWQQGHAPSVDDVREGQRLYATWYMECLSIVPEHEVVRFKDMYEGGVFTSRIRSFLTEPTATNPFHTEGEENPLIDRWQNPFERTFRDNLVVQREILIQALHEVADTAGVLDELTSVFRRLPDFLAVISRAQNARVPPPAIENEADLQVVVGALLRLLFADVRSEDPVPQQAGGASRVDFLLRDAGVIVETKMTRPTLSDRKLGEELLIDWGRYPRHPDCRAIFALIFDPGRHVENASALEHDLSQNNKSPATRVVVVR